MSHQVVGLDIGHSATKITLDTKFGVERVLYPSLATPAFKITYEAEAKRAERETVEVDGKGKFFIGETARVQADKSINTGLSDEWVLNDEHEALVAFAAKIAKESAPDDIEGRMVVVGLPVSSFENLKEPVREQVERYFSGATVAVVPQPLSGYFNLITNRKGEFLNPDENGEASYAIVDMGHFTTDYIIMDQGRWVQRASGSGPGVHLAAQNLQEMLKEKGLNINLIACEKAIREHKLKAARMLEGFDLDQAISASFSPLVSKAINQFEELAGDRIYDLDAIIIVGGGADFLYPVFKEKWPFSSKPDDIHNQPQDGYAVSTLGLSSSSLSGPRFLVSEGFYRYGRNRIWLEQVTKGAV